jgi:hypothetical protein
MKLVEQLSLAEVDDLLPDGASFKITLRVLGATTVHLLKMTGEASRGCSTCLSAVRK